MSEIHGMSQRGGSVSTHVRFGKKVYSPVISDGEADILVSFEKVEAVRWLVYLKRGGILVVNDHEIHPLSVLTGAARYPDRILEQLREEVPNFISLNAGSIAEGLGGIKAQNIVLLGALVRCMNLDDIDWKSVLMDTVSPKMYDLNARAFDAGKSGW
jgi:indolepyruvate ferredoxin oxidoreductase beta subunit